MNRRTMMFWGMVIIVFVTVDASTLPNFCEEELDSGGDDCDLLVRRYAYDAFSGRCKRFMFSGCGGNKNNFESMRVCTQTCTCFAPAAKGDAICGRNGSTRFFYNGESGKCEEFYYRGCNGNRNNFRLLSECKNRCICQRQFDPGRCTKNDENKNSTVYFFNMKINKCQIALYGGCGGNENRFDSMSECKEFCICSLDPATGPCMAYYPSYFYNSTSKECEKFVYGGCGGNANRFRLKEFCRSTCKD